MKRTILSAVVALLISVGAYANGNENTTEARANVIVERVNEISNSDLRSLGKEERRELKKELKSLKKELRTMDTKATKGLDSRLSISIGALIIIILLLIILL